MIGCRWLVLAAALAGLLLGWLLWGRGNPEEAERALDYAALVRARTASREKVIARLLAERDRLQATERAHEAAARTHQAEARDSAAAAARHAVDVQAALARGDNGAARAGAIAQANALGMAYQACDQAGVELDSALAACRADRAKGDTVLALRDQTIDEQAGAIDSLSRVARHARRMPRWAAGPVWEPGRLLPVGGRLDRELGPIRVSVEVTDGPAEGATGRIGVLLRF